MDSSHYLTLLLVGEPLLRRTLSLQMHEPLRQRIAVQYHLEELSREELDAYLAHQFKSAGVSQLPVDETARQALYQPTKGILRKVNKLVMTALRLAATRKVSVVNEAILWTPPPKPYFEQDSDGIGPLAGAAAGATVAHATAVPGRAVPVTGTGHPVCRRRAESRQIPAGCESRTIVSSGLRPPRLSDHESVPRACLPVRITHPAVRHPAGYDAPSHGQRCRSEPVSGYQRHR